MRMEEKWMTEETAEINTSPLPIPAEAQQAWPSCKPISGDARLPKDT